MSEEPSIKKKTFFATLWTVSSRMAIRLIGMVSLVIMAKILGPEDYGLVGKAMVVYGFLELVTELGLEAALITNQKASQDHYNTVWTIHILRGLFIALMLLILAYPASIFMKEEEIRPIFYCYAAVSFVGGFYNIGVVNFRKEMTFSKDFYYNLGAKIAGFVVAVTTAYIWETYWALVFGIVASTVSKIILSFSMSPMRPKLSLVEFKSLFDFSKWMLLNELISAISSKADGFMLSVFTSTANVGIYNMSYEISGLPSTEIAMPVGRACTPSFSKLKDNMDDFSDMYISTISIVLAIVIPAATGVSILAEQVVHLVLDESWVDAIPVIQVLSMYGLCRATFPTYISAMLAYNRPDILTKTSFISVFYTVAISYVGISQFGFMGLVWGVLLVGIIRVTIAQFIARHLKILSFRTLAKNIWRVLLANFAMIAGLFYYLQFDIAFLDGMLLIKFILDVFVGASVFGITLVTLWVMCGKCEGPEKAILGTLLKGRWGTS
ncbi:MAG: lipopolysaccharide biosynthesis protein [Alphaproteobacteria bacterium]|nr:lipopolysaccharide biosynthesis protein [Alphaproteobacteria bacterium]HPF45476.1 lipopolysaccharide biosynthesis protein [Emcibacteraceae bacterium]